MSFAASGLIRTVYVTGAFDIGNYIFCRAAFNSVDFIGIQPPVKLGPLIRRQFKSALMVGDTVP